MYGDEDWMDLNLSGHHISFVLKEWGAKVYLINDSDHHMYIDNPQQTYQTIEDFITAPFAIEVILPEEINNQEQVLVVDETD